MTPVEILRKARALIEDPKRWTKNAFARLPDGRNTYSTDPEAVCFCSGGAIYRAAPDSPDSGLVEEVAWSYLEAVVKGRVPGAANPVTEFNDTNSHADVLAAFDRAIALAEKESQP